MYYGSGHSIWRLYLWWGRQWRRLPKTWRDCIVAGAITARVTLAVIWLAGW